MFFSLLAQNSISLKIMLLLKRCKKHSLYAYTPYIFLTLNACYIYSNYYCAHIIFFKMIDDCFDALKPDKYNGERERWRNEI
jgi:hypothetical protein